MKTYRPKIKITGHLDILVDLKEEEDDGEIVKWQDVLIHGDPEGLRSLAAILLEIADIDQNDIDDLPIGAREHLHLRPKYELSNSSVQVIIGRLDAKGTGEFYPSYIPSEK
ncbi:MAG TPA: hypothetical protein VGS79_25175 [Puia sp.]|nr:hypothetical protein [Puia sp.]